jgi:YVTN family beta-propeller protein
LRIIQTNSAGDNVHIIDPSTNKVVGQITGIEVGHGAAAAPDGSRLYVSNEADSTLDVVDGRTLRVMSKVPLTGHPNNIAASRDGARVYVSIARPGRGGRGGHGVAATGEEHSGQGRRPQHLRDAGRALRRGRLDRGQEPHGDRSAHRGAGVDARFDLGVRPLAFEQNPDWIDSRIFVQLSDLNGFAVVDFATHKEVTRDDAAADCRRQEAGDGGGNTSHGMAVTADNTLLVVNSRLNSAVYVYSLPDLKLAGPSTSALPRTGSR